MNNHIVGFSENGKITYFKNDIVSRLKRLVRKIRFYTIYQIRAIGIMLFSKNPEKYIPGGIYCDGCPFHSRVPFRRYQENGWCWYMKKGDVELGWGLLWDGCKECGIDNESEEEDDVPNEVSMQAISEADAGIGTTTVHSIDELMKAMED